MEENAPPRLPGLPLIFHRARLVVVGMLAIAILPFGCQDAAIPDPPDEVPIDSITFQVLIRRVAPSGKEARMFGTTATVFSGDTYRYREDPLRLTIKPVSNGDRTITVSGEWMERANTSAPRVNEITPFTVTDGVTFTDLRGTLRVVFTGIIHERGTSPPTHKLPPEAPVR